MNLLPSEIIEMIFWYCDGRTLLAARDVCEDWRYIVDSLAKKCQGFCKSCKEEIPEKELAEYLEQHDIENLQTWFYIYKKWIVSKGIAKTELQAVPKLSEKSHISCINTFNNYIAVGTHDGCLKIFNQDWQLINTKTFKSTPLTKIDFMYNTEKFKVSNLKIVVTHTTSKLFLDDLLLTDSKVLIIKRVSEHRVHKDHICIMMRLFITVRKLKSIPAGETSLETIYKVDLFCPRNIHCLKMWNGKGTFLFHHEVRTIDYYHPDTDFPKLRYGKCTTCTRHAFRDDVLILIDPQTDMIEMIILEDESVALRKIFKYDRIFKGNITCAYLYGNTLTFGLDSGYVYFYHVSSSDGFSLGKGFNAIFIDSHPIQDIIVKDGEERRSYLITTSVNVYEVVEKASAADLQSINL